MRMVRYAVSVLVAFIVMGSAPAASPQATFVQKELSTDAALTIAQGALEKCRADGYRITIAIIDSNNMLKTFVRDDGSNIFSFDLSRRKAYTALAFRKPSGDQAKIWRAAVPPVVPPPDTVAGAGGLPIKVGDEVIGAIGISGAPNGDKDEACAMAGLAKLADRLK